MTCSFAECFHDARWNPVLVLHAPPRFREPGYAPDYARTSLVVCDAHRVQLTVEALLPGGEWAEIVRTFERVGRRRPSRPHTDVAFDVLPERVRVVDVRAPFTPR